MSKNLFSVNNGKITSNSLPITENKKNTKKTDSDYYKKIYNDELAKQRNIRNQIDSDFYNQGVQTTTGIFSTQRNILPTQQQTEITKNKKFEVYNTPLQKNKEIENVFQTIKKSDEYKAKQKELTEQSNKVGYAKYDYDKSVVDNDKIGWLDKTLGTVVGGAKSIFDISGGLVNENGNTYYLPNQTELKQEKTQKSYDTKIGKLLGSAGYEMGKIGASTLMNQVLPGTGTGLYWSKMFIDGTNSAMQEGYDSGSAIAYGAVNTGFEYLTGKLLGSATKGLTGGKSSGYEELLNKVFNKILNKPKLANVLANAGSEATEEFIQEYLDNLSKIAILKKSKNIKDYTSVFTNKDVLSDAIYSALVGAITGGTIGTLTGEDTNVDNENVYEILTSELEDTKKDTDDKETINAIDNLIQSINDAKNGNININDSQASELESLITEYEEYEELKNQNKITQEQEQRMIELQQQITQLQSQISENNANQNNNPTRIPTVNDIVNREATQKGNNPILPVGENISGNVVADNSTNLPIGDSIKASFNSEILPTRELTFLESAKANGINPDLKPIQDIDRMFKLRGIKASFSPLNTTQYGLYRTSTDIDGNRIRQVVLNPVAGNKQLIQETAVHELYHDLFSGRNATDMNKLIRTFNERYGDFAKARQALADAYARVYPEMDRNSAEFNAIIDEEVAANILARKLGNQEYINRLVHEEPSLARRIYNFVIDRLNKLNRLVGYKSERLFWEDVKNKFDKAYREEYKRNNSEAYTKYHTTENISSNIDKVLNDINERNPVKLRDYTPTVLVENGIKDLPMYENPAHIRKNILTEQQARNLGLQVNAKDHFHGLGKDLYVSVIDSLDNPRVIFKNKNSNNEFLILTMVKDNNNNNIIVPIEVETTTKVNNLLIDINRIKTIYGYDRKMPDLNKYIKDNINADKLEKIYEQKKNPSTDITPQLDSSKNNISQNDNNVKSDISTKYSIQENQNNTPELDNSSFSSAKKDYRGSHQIENANKITDLDLNEIKEKVIEANGGLSKQDYSDLNKLKKILNSPNETVKIYRASPVNELNDGDWVTTDKSYAKNVAEQNGGKVYEYEVKADQLFYPDDVKSLPSLHRLSSFRYNDSVSNSSEIQGMNVTKSQVEDAVYEKFDEMSSEYGFDVDEIMGVYLHGSRLRGTANPDSDLDAVVFYIGNESEDYIFNTINDDNNQLVIDGVKVDINPVSIDSLSEMDEYIERSEEYDKEVLSKNVRKTNNLNEYIEDVATREAIQNENNKQSVKESIQSYLDENDIKNPTKEDMMNAFGWYEEYDAASNPSDIKQVEKLYSEVADELLKEKKISLKAKEAKDSEGRTLSKQQQEYFKDSKVRDENGNLLVVYHGSHTEFNVFDKAKTGEKGKNAWGSGFYFTPNQEYTKKFGDKTKQTYLNIKNPYVVADDYTLMNVVNMRQEALSDGYDLDDYLKEEGYDGLIVYDEDTDGNDLTEIVAFEPNQIKSVDNTNPTEDADIRYSQENSRWERYLNNHYKREGTGQTINGVKLPIGDTVKASIDMPSQEEPEESERIPIEKSKLKKVMNPNEISKLTFEDANTTPILPTRKVEIGKGESKFASNIEKKTNMLSDSSKSSILSSKEVNYYKQVANEESLEKAFDKINNGGQSETFNWLKKDSANATSVDVAEGWILLKQYQDAALKETDAIKKDELNRSMVEVAKKMREIGTKAGQTVQAFNILNRLTPEGMVYYAQSELSEAYDKMVKNKTREWIDENREKFVLTPEETQFIMDNMEEIRDMDDGYDKRVKLAEIQKLMTDKLPPEKGAKVKSWMRISMLFNPKTQVRNVAGNALIAPINYFGDMFSSYADKIIAKKTGVRTTGNMNVKAILKGLKQGAYEATNDYRKGINTKDMEGNRFEISEGKSFSDKNAIGRALNRTESLLNYVMDVGDRVFSQASFENSLQNQMVLNNTTEITQDMIDIARAESLQRTWNDNNAYTSFVLNVRKGLNKLNINGYGLGDILIPFAKTPANLTKAIVDYSPLGLVKAISEGNTLKKSLTNGQYTSQMQHKFVQDLGKATAGTMLYILGYALAKAKITSGKSDDDKDVANFLKNTLGISSYSIKIGNKSFTYDWAQPIAAPLSIMSNIATSTNKGQALMEGIVGSLDTAGAILLEQSFLQSINEVLTDNEGFVSGLVNSVLDLPARAIPTFSKQIADMVDGTQRTSFEYDKPLETAVNKIKAKIPFVSRSLAPVVDTMGREVQKYGGKNNIFNVFLNPANVNTENISNSAKEIYRLYKSTGETDIMPRVAPYYVNQNGEKITMTSDQRAKYQKVSGSIIEKSIKELLTDSKYKNMNDTEKADIINKIVNYSYNKAKEEVLNVPMSNTYNKVSMYTKDNGSVADYYLNKEEIDYSYSYPEKYKTITKITTYDKYLNYQNKIDEVKKTYTNTNQRKNAVINYVNTLDLSIPQKAMLIKMNYSSFNTYNSQIIDYVNKQPLSVEEKSQILSKLGFKVKDGRVY